MILNIRGALGTQVIELLAGYARAIETNDTVDEIVANLGGDIVPTAKVNYIPGLFVTDAPVGSSMGTHKQRAWNIKDFKLILKHREEIFKRIHVRKQDVACLDKILHVRVGDRQLISDDQYDTYWSKNIDLTQVGNSNHLKVRNDPATDWRLILNAKEVHCSISSFPISTFLVNPLYRKLRVFHWSKHDGPGAISMDDIATVDQFLSIIPDGEWIQ